MDADHPSKGSFFHAESQPRRGCGDLVASPEQARKGHYEGRELAKNVKDASRLDPTEEAVPATT